MKNANKKIKLCLLHSTLHIGGAEEVTANICRTIDKSVFDVTVCCLKEMGLIGQKIIDQGTDVVNLSSGDKKKTDYLTSLRLRKYIKESQIDLVHSHDVHSLVDASICRLSLSSFRLIHTFHFGNYPNREPGMAKFEKLFWRVPDLLVSVAEKQKDDISQYYRIPENRIKKVWNGVDVINSGQNNEIVDNCRESGKVIIGCVNTLIKQKGMFDLLKVAIRLRDKVKDRFVFVIAGDGPLREQLEKEIEANQLSEQVKLLGWVDSASAVILPKIDIFFQPSLWEAMSMVLLEAMANQKAIVTTDVGETSKIINSDDIGIVVKAGDIDAMVSSLLLLIESKSHREKLGANAKAKYEDEFTAVKMSARYAEIYKSVIS